jgi:hypothetical protein
MFEFNLNSFQPGAMDDWRGTRLHARRFNAAVNLFNTAALRGRLYRLLAGLRRRPQWLLDLSAVRAGRRITNACYRGLRAVCIDRIAGSESRSREFDRGFHPVGEHQRERWAGMALAHISHVPLPPVQLIQLGEQYFVRDGHHRISVARLLHQQAIDAEVIEWELAERAPEAAPAELDPVAIRARSSV